MVHLKDYVGDPGGPAPYALLGPDALIWLEPGASCTDGTAWPAEGEEAPAWRYTAYRCLLYPSRFQGSLKETSRPKFHPEPTSKEAGSRYGKWVEGIALAP